MKRLLALTVLVALGLYLTGSSPAGGKDEIELDGLKSKTPPGWEVAKPSSKLQMYRIVLPKVAGDDKDAEMTIFHFGKGGGGSLDANIDRWRKMFDKPTENTERYDVGKVRVTVVDLKGTYLEKFPPFDPNAKVTRRPDYRMFGVYFDSPNGPFFVRAVGPAKTMEQHKKNFDGWLKGFK